MHFDSWQDYQKYSFDVRSKRRHIFDEPTEYFLKVVAHTAGKRKKLIKNGSMLWRAQKGSDTAEFEANTGEKLNVECPYPVERMKPLINRAMEGRANPKGISLLYLCDDKDTAMSEVRPWVGSDISVGLFRLNRQISVVDCTSDVSNSKKFFLENPPPDEREKTVWGNINEAFSIPIENSDGRSDYVPTQILAELFRSEGYDGIAYKSLVGKGLNIVLFDLSDATPENGYLFVTKSVQFKFEDHISPRSSRIYKE